jgi:hypothetical protein
MSIRRNQHVDALHTEVANIEYVLQIHHIFDPLRRIVDNVASLHHT